MNEIILDSLSLHDSADRQLLPSKQNQTLSETDYFNSMKQNYVHGYIRMIDSNSIFYNSEVNIILKSPNINFLNIRIRI